MSDAPSFSNSDSDKSRNSSSSQGRDEEENLDVMFGGGLMPKKSSKVLNEIWQQTPMIKE